MFITKLAELYGTKELKYDEKLELAVEIYQTTVDILMSDQVEKFDLNFLISETKRIISEVIGDSKELKPCKLFQQLDYYLNEISSEKVRKDIQKNSIKNRLLYQLLLTFSHNKFKDSGIYYENGIWYLSSTKKFTLWPKIGGKALSSFPNRNFHKHHHIGREDGGVFSKEELIKLFQKLGLRTATYQEELKRWKKLIIRNSIELNKVGIILEEDGKWNIRNVKNKDLWPKIEGKNLSSFPAPSFNRSNNIGKNNGFILTSDDLEELLIFLGFEVIR